MNENENVIKNLITKYENLKSSLSPGLEKASCDIYIKVFLVCQRKARKDKHEAYIKEQFSICDRKRLDFRLDDQTEDALIEALKQEAYRQVWRACKLPEGVLVAQKMKMHGGFGTIYKDTLAGKFTIGSKRLTEY